MRMFRWRKDRKRKVVLYQEEDKSWGKRVRIEEGGVMDVRRRGKTVAAMSA